MYYILWHIRVIPTYRVYRLYDNIVDVILAQIAIIIIIPFLTSTSFPSKTPS